MIPTPLIIRTARLDLVATMLPHLDAELAAAEGVIPHPLEALLAAHVPASWPPGLYDVDAIRFFHDQLGVQRAAALGWCGPRARPATIRTACTGAGRH